MLKTHRLNRAVTDEQVLSTLRARGPFVRHSTLIQVSGVFGRTLDRALKEMAAKEVLFSCYLHDYKETDSGQIHCLVAESSCFEPLQFQEALHPRTGRRILTEISSERVLDFIDGLPSREALQRTLNLVRQPIPPNDGYFALQMALHPGWRTPAGAPSHAASATAAPRRR